MKPRYILILLAISTALVMGGWKWCDGTGPLGALFF